MGRRRAHAELPRIQMREGRPKRGEETYPVTKALRLPQGVWDLLEARAVAAGTNTHALMRKLVIDFLRTDTRTR